MDGVRESLYLIGVGNRERVFECGHDADTDTDTDTDIDIDTDADYDLTQILQLLLITNKLFVLIKSSRKICSAGSRSFVTLICVAAAY